MAAGILRKLQRWDRQPTSPAAVLLASPGTPFSMGALDRAAKLAGGERVAVLAILKIYGSSFGLPNPGLLPSRREQEEQLGNVRRAISRLERQGCTADGQVAATRNAGRMIAKVARARQVRHVVMDRESGSGLARLTGASVIRTVRRRLRGHAVLDVVSSSP
jgi:hypothetical protein